MAAFCGVCAFSAKCRFAWRRAFIGIVPFGNAGGGCNIKEQRLVRGKFRAHGVGGISGTSWSFTPFTLVDADMSHSQLNVLYTAFVPLPCGLNAATAAAAADHTNTNATRGTILIIEARRSAAPCAACTAVTIWREKHYSHRSPSPRLVVCVTSAAFCVLASTN